MNSDDRALVKEIFNAGVGLPEGERSEFVRLRADGNQAVEKEVLSLLGYHQEETLLESGAALIGTVAEGVSSVPPESIEIETSAEIEPNLILQEVWKENSRTLRRRLIAISLVLATLISISMLRLFTFKYAALGYGFRVYAFVVTLGSAWCLYRIRDLSLKQIRLIELAVMSSVAVLAIVVNLRLMIDAAVRGDAVMLIAANHWNHMVWALLILIYGTFMPNTWQRAAWILFPASLMPYWVTMCAELIDPQVNFLMDQDEMGIPIPLTLIAAGVSVFAAHLIHDARLGAIQARYLSQYRIIRQIGSGGMGKVFEAEHLLLKRPCAIKLIRPELTVGQSALQRFQQEVRASARLTHPNTIEIYDYGLTEDETFFYAMELLPGANLSDLVKCSGPLPPERAVHFLIQICGALREAHSAGLVHRDIKPANIFATQRGGICDFSKLLDFGLVKQFEYQSDRHKKHVVEGTPRYMAPEQILSPAVFDPRSDLYSLGCVGYYLLTGQTAFDGSSSLAIMQSQVNAKPVPPSTHRADLPSDLEAVIMRCLEKDPMQRFQTAKALQEALSGCGVGGLWSEKDAERAFGALEHAGAALD
ncbi:MAG: serine/threonine protein kinase [Planctomycetaceae bacterium]|nr:serine/threonine protein kinase [Planctomycetaceae bacterium]